MQQSTILLILTLIGIGTCSDIGRFQEWQELISQLQDDSSKADPPSLVFASATNGSTHQEIIQELGLSTSEIQGSGCQFSAGTYGGGGGGSFNDHHCSGTISRIVIRSGSVIDSIKVTFKLSNGQYTHGGYHGGGGGGLHTIDINVNQGEKIIGIFGRSGSLVDQLGFITNMGRIFGPYGSCGGRPFTVNSCEVRGIFGRSGSLLDSIGFLCSHVN